jgi:hypothetical protein
MPRIITESHIVTPHVDEPLVKSLSVSPAGTPGAMGYPTATIHLNGPAGTGGCLVHYSSSNPAVAKPFPLQFQASEPDTAYAAEGASETTFGVQTYPVNQVTHVELKAWRSAFDICTAVLVVVPPVLAGLYIDPVAVSGEPANARFTLTGPPSTGRPLIHISADVPNLLQAETFYGGQTTNSPYFLTWNTTLIFGAVTQATSVEVSASCENSIGPPIVRQATVMVKPVSFDRFKTPHGKLPSNDVTDWVLFLNGHAPPPDGVYVHLGSSDSNLLRPDPVDVQVTAGYTQAYFKLYAGDVPEDRDVTLTGTYIETHSVVFTIARDPYYS